MATARTQYPTLGSLASLVGVALASLSVTGCTNDALFARPETAEDYDAQACVETALRHGPDAEGVREGTVAFATACQEGEAASCSVLGVMYELGRGFPTDAERAIDLYRTACNAHNARGCANLSALLRTEGTGSRDRLATIAP